MHGALFQGEDLGLGLIGIGLDNMVRAITYFYKTLSRIYAIPLEIIFIHTEFNRTRDTN